MDKDKILIHKTCINCGKEFHVSHGYCRRKNVDYNWKCPTCMKQYRSNLQKTSDTNISKIIKNKLSNPSESKVYKNNLSSRAIIQWNSKSDAEKQKQIQLMNKGHKQYISNLSLEDKDKIAYSLKQYYQNRSSNEELKHKKLLSKSRIRYFNNMTEEERKDYSNLYKKSWESKSEKEKEKVSEFMKNLWKNMSDDERAHQIELYRISQKSRWDNTSKEARLIHGIHVSNGISKLSPEEKERIRNIHQQRWMNMSQEEKYNILQKTFISSNGNNKFHKTFEDTFNNSYISNNYFLEEEIVTDNNISKSWDYGVYDKANLNLVMVIDLDGSYFHADNCDYDGMHSKEEYDEKRLESIPDGIKYHIIYENKFKQSFESMIKTLMIEYELFIKDQYNLCRSDDFPFPKYSNDELMKSYSKLLRMDCDSKYINVSINTRIGDRLITHFHSSIWHASVSKNISPYDAWHDDDLLRKVIANRMIYINVLNPNKILQGFNICKIATKVSVFSAGRAKILIHKYLHEFNEVFDPFSGFSGRMLGCISLGKKYIGQDISEIHVKESNNILQFLYDHGVLMDASVRQEDILQSSGTYESLFTCSPYSNKEHWLDVPDDIRSCDDWIDECLSRFKCKRYVFVVDYTDRYKDHIVDEIINKSHFGSNSEKIIIIEKGDIKYEFE